MSLSESKLSEVSDCSMGIHDAVIRERTEIDIVRMQRCVNAHLQTLHASDISSSQMRSLEESSHTCLVSDTKRADDSFSRALINKTIKLTPKHMKEFLTVARDPKTTSDSFFPAMGCDVGTLAISIIVSRAARRKQSAHNRRQS